MKRPWLPRFRLQLKRDGLIRSGLWEEHITPYHRGECRWVATYIGPTVKLARTNPENGHEYTLAVRCRLHGAHDASGDRYLYAEGWVRAGRRNVYRLVELTEEESAYCVAELTE